MSIATELTRIQQAKADIKTAIEAKGVTVPSSATIDTYDDYVSQISGGGADTPSAFTSWSYNDYGRPTNFVLKDGVTTIPPYFLFYNEVLTSCTIPSGVTTIGGYAFSNVGTNTHPFDVSNINFTSVSASTIVNNSMASLFNSAKIKGNITLPNSLFTNATSGYSGPCYQLFDGAIVPNNCELTINIYANNIIIPRNAFCFNNGTTVNKGKINIIVHGTPSFLSPQSFRVITGTGVDAQSVTFVDCTSPPDASKYDTSSNSPFYGFKGTLYVPSAGLTAWQNKYTGIASQIQAIPNS